MGAAVRYLGRISHNKDEHATPASSLRSNPQRRYASISDTIRSASAGVAGS